MTSLMKLTSVTVLSLGLFLGESVLAMIPEPVDEIFDRAVLEYAVRQEQIEKVLVGLTPEQRAQLISIYAEKQEEQRRAEFNHPKREKQSRRGQERSRCFQPKK